ncbi:SAM-dependent methyltransferase [Exidia glandulosa HHB12029]|uniref:SAM-dependent methyltransferase n=1 Tax=Exidia glandulosa HHB12029 TaxID=1314781 RepID=A0A165KL56_EXIGL|nr:SAM-dependent methyltransferase [Exidia glandulosa HHB12029]
MSDTELTRDVLVELFTKYHGHAAVSKAQLAHRFALVDAFAIKPGDRVLELGCGQGDCTAALAQHVGPNGHVTAVDPAPAGYGSPLTVHEAQDLLSTDPHLGARITWIRDAPISYLSANTEEKWDVAVLAQCLWYFASPTVIRDTLRALVGRVKRVAIAEFALNTKEERAVPHVLAALTQGALAVFDPTNTSNIRTCIGPEIIKTLASEAGLKLVEERLVTPAQEYQDAGWEIGAVRDEGFGKSIDTLIPDERARAYVHTMRRATLDARDRLQGKPRSMDVWVALFDV